MRRCIFIVALMLITALFQGQGSRPELDVRLTLLNQVYEINQPLEVYVTVVNSGTEPVNLALSPFFERNFDFQVRTIQNMHVKPREDYQLMLLERRNQSPSPRNVTLLPGEEYGRVFNLSERFMLNAPGHYVVHSHFFVQPLRSEFDWFVRSNMLRFQLNPAPLVARIIEEHKERVEHDALRVLDPAQTIEFMLNAKQNRDWDNYFRYMDEERLIDTSFLNFREEYAAAPFGRREAIVQRFKEFMKDYPSERIEFFHVDRVTIERDERTAAEDAQVVCRIHYRHSGEARELLERKVYHFRLYRQNERWYVYSYYVVNI